MPKINTRILQTFLTALFIVAGTLVAIQYAKGSFRITQEGIAPATGLLNANSFPSGARVFIEGKFASVTDDTLYLEPGSYQVEVTKDGYSPWKKKVIIEEELVVQTNAQLFPTAASFTPLTFTGVTNITASPNGHKLLYYTASASAQTKNGLYVLELANSPLSLQREPKHILEDVPELDLANAHFIWSPDSSEVMLITDSREVLLSPDKKNDFESLTDSSFQRKKILSEWEEEMYIREREFLGEFPPEIIKIATQSARNAYISPDKKRLLYTATASAQIPTGLVPPLPASSHQEESRSIEPNNIYVYDMEEDKNFFIGQAAEPSEDDENSNAEITAETINKFLLARDLYNKEPLKLEASPGAFTTLQSDDSLETKNSFSNYHGLFGNGEYQWFSDSKHLLFTKDETIKIIAYDATNETTLYSGPFLSDFIYPWPDGSRVLMMTSFGSGVPLNLYAIELK